MKKKISYILIGAICSSILSYGLVAYADYDSSATKEDKLTANATYVVPSKTDAAAVKTASAQPSISEAPIQLEQLKALELKIDGNNVKVKIELEKEEAKTDSKVEIKIGEDQKKYLTGNEATQFIQQLLTVLKLQVNMDKQQVKDALFTHFAVEPAKVELSIDIQLKDRPEKLKFKEEKDDDADVDDEDAKVQTAQLTVQDNQKKQLAANDQSAKQERQKTLIAQKKALQQAWQKAHKEQQEKKKQQKQWNRSDRDHDQNKGQKGDEDDDDQGEDHGEDHGHDGDHGKHHVHEEHDDKD